MYYVVLCSVVALSVVISMHILCRLINSLGNVSWSKEVKRFLEKRIEELYKRNVLEEVYRVIEQLLGVPRVLGILIVIGVSVLSKYLLGED